MDSPEFLRLGEIELGSALCRTLENQADLSATHWNTLATGKTSSRPQRRWSRTTRSNPSRSSLLPGPKARSTSTRPLSPGLAGAGSGFEDGRRKMPAVSFQIFLTEADVAGHCRRVASEGERLADVLPASPLSTPILDPLIPPP